MAGLSVRLGSIQSRHWAALQDRCRRRPSPAAPSVCRRNCRRDLMATSHRGRLFYCVVESLTEEIGRTCKLRVCLIGIRDGLTLNVFLQHGSCWIQVWLRDGPVLVTPVFPGAHGPVVVMLTVQPILPAPSSLCPTFSMSCGPPSSLASSLAGRHHRWYQALGRADRQRLD